MNDFRIEKGVPAPSTHGRVNTDAEVFDRMDVGDSILFADSKEANRFAGHCHGHSKNTEHTVTRRKVEGGYRIWKVLRRANSGAA